MRRALHNANADLTKQYPDYVVRIVSDEHRSGGATLAALPILSQICLLLRPHPRCCRLVSTPDSAQHCPFPARGIYGDV